MNAIDNHKFHVESKKLEILATESALEKALSQQEKGIPEWKASMLARRISKEVFENFKTKITELFPSPSYSNLISLTLEARINYFFQNLLEQIKLTIQMKKN